LRREGEIDIEDLPQQFHRASNPGPALMRVPASGIDFNEVVGDLEADLIQQALELTHWNKNRAAQLLGLNRTTLLEKIKKKGIEPSGDS
jgi:DNA-binding NtrC family response regulator